MEHMGIGFGLGFLNLIGTVLFWVALIWVVRFFVRGGFRNGGMRKLGRGRYAKWYGDMKRGDWHKGSRPWEPDEADKLLRERLAKGEVTEDEYTRLKDKLSENGENGGANGSSNANGSRSEGKPLGWLGGDNALEVARLRLAKGEITPDEYETIRRVLAS